MSYSDKDYDFDLFLPKSQGKNERQDNTSGKSQQSSSERNSSNRGSVASRNISSHSSREISSSSGRRPSRNISSSSRDISSVSNKKRSASSRSGDAYKKGKYSFADHDASSSKNRKKKRRKKQMSAITRIALSVFLVLTITVLLVVGIFAVYVFAFVDGTLDYELTDLKLDYTSVMYATDENGKEYELAGVHSTENRIWVDYDEVPKHLYDAIVAIEDKRFYDHEGVDWRRTFYSFANFFFDFADMQGGSTITQQLVKNLTKDDDISAMRKIQEIMRSRYVEANYSKEVILECYVNVITYGNGCYGIETASQYYFGHSASQLTVAESAAIAALIKSPQTMNPKNAPETNKERREYVLSLMLEQELIDDATYKQALAEEIVVKSSTVSTTNVNINTWFEDYVIQEVVDDLCKEYGYTKGKAENMIYNGGLRIYTTYDAKVQSAIDEVYANPSNFLRKKNIAEDPQSGLVVLDYKGHILGLMGGYGTKDQNMLLNRATSTKRPVGSTIKPLSAYSPAIEFDAITYSTIIDDNPIKLADGSMWPQNADRKYRGSTYVWDGLRRSVNTISARLVQTLTPQKSFDYLTNKYHISTLVSGRANSEGKVLTDVSYGPMAIGSLTDGATVLEMTAAYATIGNLGYYYEPTSYTKVTDKNGTILLEYDSKAQTAISEDTATIMNKMMQNVMRSGTGAKGAFDGRQLYGKTGTTSDTKDLWFIGGSAQYICGVWYGYDQPQKMNGMSMNPALKVWKAVMQKAHSGLEKKTFAVSSDVTYRYYCTETGLLATDACTSAQLGWYKDSYLPTCTTHKGAILKEQSTSAKPFTKPVEEGSETPPETSESDKNAETEVGDEMAG